MFIYCTCYYAQEIIVQVIIVNMHIVLCIRLSDPIEFIRRPSGLGLGAVPAPPDLMDNKKKRNKNKIKLPGDVERKVGVVTSLGGRGQCWILY